MIEFDLSELRTPPNMEERSQPPRPMAARGCGSRISAETTSRKARTKGEGGDPVRCTGRQCRSCTGGAVADCVAICCCPCAVLNCLALAFVKIPFLIGKRWCLGFRRKKRRKKNKKGRKQDSVEGGDGDAATKEGNDGGSGNGGIDSWFEIGFDEGEFGGRSGEGCGDIGGGDESDKVWVELCEFDHLSFGRVSFAGIPLQS